MKVKIRRAKEADLPELVDLLKQLFTIESAFEVNEKKHEQALRMLLGESDRYILLVAQVSEKVIGMCSVQVLISTAEGGRAGLVEDLVVTQRYRGKGIGHQLLDGVKEWAGRHGLTRLQLLTDRANRPAQAFYHDAGWRHTGMIALRKSV